MITTVKLSDESYINCNIINPIGNEKYNSINSTYYKQADAVLLVYDITNKQSFNIIKDYYVYQIKSYCKEKVIVELLGNKSDKENKRQVSIEEGIIFAREHNYVFLESSCLQNKNVNEAFKILIERWNLENKRNFIELNKYYNYWFKLFILIFLISKEKVL